MASSAEYLEYVLDLLADVPDVTTRKMMGEFLLSRWPRLWTPRHIVKATL